MPVERVDVSTFPRELPFFLLCVSKCDVFKIACMLHYGKLKGEFEALQMISKYESSAVIIIAFMPIHGTPMRNASPPTSTDIAKILALTRLMMPDTPMVLGCMCPKGKSKGEIDVLAVEAGKTLLRFQLRKQ